VGSLGTVATENIAIAVSTNIANNGAVQVVCHAATGAVSGVASKITEETMVCTFTDKEFSKFGRTEEGKVDVIGWIVAPVSGIASAGTTDAMKGVTQEVANQFSDDIIKTAATTIVSTTGNTIESMGMKAAEVTARKVNGEEVNWNTVALSGVTSLAKTGINLCATSAVTQILPATNNSIAPRENVCVKSQFENKHNESTVKCILRGSSDTITTDQTIFKVTASLENGAIASVNIDEVSTLPT